jgi:F-type H+-transporting ATPase subunit gamma
MRIRSVQNLAQVTKAMETVAASRVRKAVAANAASRPYSEKAWKVLLHLARQPGSHSLHYLLSERSPIRNVLVIMVSGDRGLAGSYNVNILRNTLLFFDQFSQPVKYLCVGKKGRDLLLRRHAEVIAEFTALNSPATFLEVSPIARLVIDDFKNQVYDQVFISYTNFENMVKQQTVIRKILPLEVEYAGNGQNVTHTKTNSVFTYEPDQNVILDEVIPRFIAIQIYHAILSSQTSEFASRMLAMHNAADNAQQLVGLLKLEYNKARQQIITNEMLDIVGGASAQEML